jgi:hypothetical protein
VHEALDDELHYYCSREVLPQPAEVRLDRRRWPRRVVVSGEVLVGDDLAPVDDEAGGLLVAPVCVRGDDGGLHWPGRGCHTRMTRYWKMAAASRRGRDSAEDDATAVEQVIGLCERACSGCPRSSS